MPAALTRAPRRRLGAAAASGARRGLAASAGLLAAGTRLPSYAAPRGARMMAAAAFGTADVRQAAQLLQKGCVRAPADARRVAPADAR